MDKATNTPPSISAEALKLRQETGKPMGWCMNEAVAIVRAWAIENGFAE